MVLMVFLLGLTSLPGSSRALETGETISVTDDLGRTVTLPEGKRRAAALLASYAQVYLLAGGEIVATTHDAWEDYDLDLGENTVDLGTYSSISLERLLVSEPDFVIASADTKAHGELAESLENTGIPVLFFRVNRFEEYLSMLSTLTGITGRQDLYEKYGLVVREEVETARKAAAEAVQANGAPRVLFVRASASGIHAKGSEGTVLGAMLQDLGCVNIADGSALENSLSLETMIVEDPDHIFVVFQGSSREEAEKLLSLELTSDPAWAGLSAVKNGRVHVMDKRLYHLKPNDRWGEAYQKLEALLYAGNPE